MRLLIPGIGNGEPYKNKAFVWNSKILCADCLNMIGGRPAMAHDWWSFQKDQDEDMPYDW
jgi:hypothetical protein